MAARRKKTPPTHESPRRAAAPRWAMLMPNLPGKATTARVRLWRRLQSVGAIAVRPSVYVLPLRDEHIETFQWVAREIVAMGGQASLCEGQFFDGVSDDEIERKFVEARNVDYTQLSEEARLLAKALRPKRLSAEKLTSAESELAKIKKRLAEIVAIDFCHASERGGVEGLVMSLDRSISAKREPESPGRLELVPRPRGATWVTRAGVHVDRIACAWLIRRFIDPNARFKFVAAKGYVPEKGELRFDMYDAEFTHVGDRCSFEVLLERMGVTDRALVPIAEIIHDIDVRDEKFARTETAGVSSQITGVCVAHREDLARIAAATPILEALYSFFGVRMRGTKGGTES
jgi:hypothetical protein